MPEQHENQPFYPEHLTPLTTEGEYFVLHNPEARSDFPEIKLIGKIGMRRLASEGTPLMITPDLVMHRREDVEPADFLANAQILLLGDSEPVTQLTMILGSYNGEEGGLESYMKEAFIHDFSSVTGPSSLLVSHHLSMQLEGKQVNFTDLFSSPNINPEEVTFLFGSKGTGIETNIKIPDGNMRKISDWMEAATPITGASFHEIIEMNREAHDPNLSNS